MRSAVPGAGALLVAALMLTACTSSGGDPAPSPSVTRTTTVTATRTETPTIGPTAPVATGPTRTAVATACPLLRQQTAADQVGMRLDRITVQKSGGTVVGCRFYALEHPTAECDATCLQGEHLPPGNQPAVTITTTRYASTRAAYNAFAREARRGSNPQQVRIGANTGVCYQLAFYAKDKGKDWTCGFSVGKTAVEVKTVVVSPALNVVLVSREVARKV